MVTALAVLLVAPVSAANPSDSLSKAPKAVKIGGITPDAQSHANWEIISQVHMVTPSGTGIQDYPLNPERSGRRVKVADRILAFTPILELHTDTDIYLLCSTSSGRMGASITRRGWFFHVEEEKVNEV